jgi:hypothetical protein
MTKNLCGEHRQIDRKTRPRGSCDAVVASALMAAVVGTRIASSARVRAEKRHPRDAEAARLREPFQACRDIDAVAEDVLALGNHVAQVDPDLERDLLLRRDARIALGHSLLDFNRAPYSVNHARRSVRRRRNRIRCGTGADTAP